MYFFIKSVNDTDSEIFEGIQTGEKERNKI